ncbi:hypothetical protein [Tanticharoenia sakaeratensis]|uniref:Uncharacterized protein n=1 Tax=Tanticharoenia sakaeratensis NBRC 103193 TaxID=1231623 RepID=A0A0D6MP87_9PROT|nr:hypothetical protein [Tanticharoenia sakaeratensis]GAN55236.1 hypothetical protein Tasa_041_031 [Tanticharoenia sakaeratensis NBRC 103193]GBQ23320.1 hypothetical protein AA103193_2374 [Tanticharoenia sakaeratensis NBRC 103193]
MTDTRKPYDPAWPHGFETRDGKKIVARFYGPFGFYARQWMLEDDMILLTDENGRCPVSDGPSDDDIFCTPAPVEKPLECWVNVYPSGMVMHMDSRSNALDLAAKVCPTRVAVHMREVTDEPAANEPGALSAEQVTTLRAALSDLIDAAADCSDPIDPQAFEFARRALAETKGQP